MGTHVIPGVGAFAPNAQTAGEPGSAAYPTILQLDIAFWIDATTGDDNSNGQVTTPWKSVARAHAFLHQFARIDSEVTIWFADSSGEDAVTPDYAPLQLPPLGLNGKVIYRSDAVFLDEHSTFTAGIGSTSTSIVSADAFAADWAGWSIECTAGANLGVRVLVSESALGEGSVTLTPSAPLAGGAGEGDSWRFIRPLATVHWPVSGGVAAVTAIGGRASDQQPGYAAAYSEAGVYWVNVRWTGKPALAECSAYLFGVEYDDVFGVTPLPLANIAAGIAGIGAALGVADVSLWKGWGLTQRRTERTALSAGLLIDQLDASSAFAAGITTLPQSFVGYVVGKSWILRSAKAFAGFHGGHLWGGVATPFGVTDGAAELGLVEPTLACLLDSQQSDVSGVIAAYGGGSHVRLSNVALDGGPDGMTLIRSLSQALIECSDQVQSPSGTTTGIAQDASGAGKILWDHQPALTGAIADLAVDLATGSNSLLATAPSILEDAITGLSWIARSTTLGATPDLPGTNGSILVRVANPATGLILAAPPAGFMNLVLLAGQNAAAALTLTFRVRDADGLQFTQGATPLAAATAAFLSTGFPLVVTSDLNADVSGGTGGTPCEFRGSYIQVRIPHGMVRAAVVLTSAYQSIPVVPASGLVAGYTIVPSYESANQGIVVVNGDSATCTPQFRLTRGATVFAWNAPVTAIGARLAPIPVMPLQAGDVLEVKLAVAPVVAGTIILRALYVPVGAAA